MLSNDDLDRLVLQETSYRMSLDGDEEKVC